MLGYVVSQDLPADLNRYLVLQLTVMKQQRPKVDPDSTVFQSMRDSVHVLEDVVGRIQEKTCCHSIEMLRPFPINLCELSSRNREVRLLLDALHFLRRRDVGNHYTTKGVFLIVVILVRAYERKYLKLLLLLNSVDNEIGSKEHEVGDLIAFCPKTRPYKLVDQPSESTAWDQNIIARPQVVPSLAYDPGIVVLLLALAAPLSVELLNCGLDLASVVGTGELVGVEVVFLLDVVDILNDLVEEVLVVTDSLLKHDGFALAVGLIVLVQGGVGEEGVFLLPKVRGIVAESTFDLVLVAKLKLFWSQGSALLLFL